MTSPYLVAILPPKQLSLQIDGIRKECARIFKVYRALKPPVHLTLMFIPGLEETFETNLIKCLGAARNFQPFTIQLLHYNSFPSNHVVYIDVLANQALQELYKNIKSATSPYQKEFKSRFTPHFTIAYRDTKTQFEQIASYYSKETFCAEFLTTCFTLLKHDGKQWNILKEFNSKPTNLQLKLYL